MPDVLTPAEKLFKKHPSLPRNPNIATVFFRSGMVESWGRGYEKVTEACAAFDASLPVVEADFGGLMVRVDESSKYRELRTTHSSLQNPNETGATTFATINATLSEIEIQIIALISTNNKITLDDIASQTDKHRATIARTIRNMKDAGIIERSGSKKTGHWRIVHSKQ